MTVVVAILQLPRFHGDGLTRFRGFAPEKSIFARMAPGKPLIIRGYMERMRAKPAVVKTYPVPAGSFRSLDSPRHVFTADPAKDGKTHSYWSVVENQRLDGGRVVQRPVLYLGEINSSQAAVWRKAIEVLDEDAGRPQTLALFPEDRCDAIASDASIVQLRLSEMRLCRPRQWGACWL
ncbi:MAG: hypothetical protein ACJ8AW_03170, partial [Rhodopila sp.]